MDYIEMTGTSHRIIGLVLMFTDADQADGACGCLYFFPRGGYYQSPRYEDCSM